MNIKITKSTYKTKENKRAIIYDCSAKNYRKKINTGIFIEDGYLNNPEITLSIALNITLEKLKDKKEDALSKYLEYNWSFAELENYLRKGIDIYSIEEYVKNDFVKNKNIITGNDYFNEGVQKLIGRRRAEALEIFQTEGVLADQQLNDKNNLINDLWDKFYANRTHEEMMVQANTIESELRRAERRFGS